MLTRRTFLQNSAAAAAFAACPRLLAGSDSRLPLGFSTLGCPAWTWTKILNFAAQNGFAAVELRGLEGNMDLPSRPEFGPQRIEQSRREIAAHNVKIACVSSSSVMHESDPQKRSQQLADARRFIDLAANLGSPYVRVFGNKIEGPRDPVLERVASGLRELGDYAGPKQVTVIIESHGDFTDSPTLLEVLRRANSPQVALLWDAHHTFAAAKEDPAFTLEKLGTYIRHTHLKDSIQVGSERHYVLTGEGDVPVKRQVQLLAKSGYKGYYSFEWEKVWHPDLAEPDVAFPQYAKAVRQYLEEANAARGAL